MTLSAISFRASDPVATPAPAAKPATPEETKAAATATTEAKTPVTPAKTEAPKDKAPVTTPIAAQPSANAVQISISDPKVKVAGAKLDTQA